MAEERAGGGRAPYVLLVAGLAFLLGAAAGFLARQSRPGEEPNEEIRGTRTGLTNPLLDCEIDTYKPGKELRPFGRRLRSLVEALEGGPGVSGVAVYFRDLDNGPWHGVSERRGFTPGSLFKLPVILAALKQAEAEPDFFHRRVRFASLPQPPPGPQWFPPAERLAPGQEYTVEELLRRTAAYSDNLAARLVLDQLRPGVFERTLSDMGIDPADIAEGSRRISAKTYSRFLRVLYNASYLDRPMSEYALSLLVDATFKDGLVAGVPPGTVVAHKFGEHGEPGPGGAMVLQLHDCGVVYHPARPYLLCVMTSGEDYRAMAQAIAEVSLEVYRAVAGQPPPPAAPEPFP